MIKIWPSLWIKPPWFETRKIGNTKKSFLFLFLLNKLLPQRLKISPGKWWRTKTHYFFHLNVFVWLTGLPFRVTRLGEILPFGLLFKGLGEFLGQNMVCCMHFESVERGWCRYFVLSNLALMKYLGIFCLATVTATFSKIWAFFLNLQAALLPFQ